MTIFNNSYFYLFFRRFQEILREVWFPEAETAASAARIRLAMGCRNFVFISILGGFIAGNG